jgi:hypothetical protein
VQKEIEMPVTTSITVGDHIFKITVNEDGKIEIIVTLPPTLHLDDRKLSEESSYPIEIEDAGEKIEIRGGPRKPGKG